MEIRLREEAEDDKSARRPSTPRYMGPKGTSSTAKARTTPVSWYSSRATTPNTAVNPSSNPLGTPVRHYASRPSTAFKSVNLPGTPVHRYWPPSFAEQYPPRRPWSSNPPRFGESRVFNLPSLLHYSGTPVNKSSYPSCRLRTFDGTRMPW